MKWKYKSKFVNKDGFHTNKIEGHWRHAKVKMPVFGIIKYMFSSYLAEFMSLCGVTSIKKTIYLLYS